MKYSSRSEAAFKIFGVFFLGTTAMITIGFFIYFLWFKIPDIDHSPITSEEADQLCQQYVQTECETLKSAYDEDHSYIDHNLDGVYVMKYELPRQDQLRISKAFAEANGEDPDVQVMVNKGGAVVIFEQSMDFLTISVTSN